MILYVNYTDNVIYRGVTVDKAQDGETIKMLTFTKAIWEFMSSQLCHSNFSEPVLNNMMPKEKGKLATLCLLKLLPSP